MLFFFFFFSSRRRHTRWTGDWSSDVCSSDLDSERPATLDPRVFAQELVEEPVAAANDRFVVQTERNADPGDEIARVRVGNDLATDDVDRLGIEGAHLGERFLRHDHVAAL